MAITYCAFAPPEGLPHTEEGADQLVFVKDGLIPIAVILPIVWMLFNRMWIPVFGYVTAMILVQVLLGAFSIPDDGIALVNALVSLYIGLEAGALRRWSLSRKGWTMVDVATGYDRLDCERQVFARWIDDEASDLIEDDRRREPSFGANLPANSGQDEVFGLFPDAGTVR